MDSNKVEQVKAADIVTLMAWIYSPELMKSLKMGADFTFTVD